MRAALKNIHRYASLALASVWIVQALTGLIMVFHWEWDDALVPGVHRPLDAPALAAALQRVQKGRPDAKVIALYATAGAPDRFDIQIEDSRGNTDVVRVDGAGDALVARPLDHDYVRAGFIQAAIVLHQTLFAGDRGRFFLGFSALILLAGIGLGLTLAWPRRGEWRRALLPSPPRARVARLYAWHRACGLWLALPALILVAAGALLAFDDPLDDFLGTGSEPAALAGHRSAGVNSLATAVIPPQDALRTALARFPSAALASMRMPAADAPWYRVRMRQPGEPERVYGRTAVYVDAGDGRVLAVDDALSAAPKQRFVNALFPTHTGEIAGLAGRLLALAVGIWLATMIVLGVSLWSGRRN